MAKDGTARGGPRFGQGRPNRAISEKISAGNPGGRKLKVMEMPKSDDLSDSIAELSGEDMPVLIIILELLEQRSRFLQLLASEDGMPGIISAEERFNQSNVCLKPGFPSFHCSFCWIVLRITIIRRDDVLQNARDNISPVVFVGCHEIGKHTGDLPASAVITSAPWYPEPCRCTAFTAADPFAMVSVLEFPFLAYRAGKLIAP